ncbi:hypothetical protein ElyMa_000039600, partial [Elysia marginata]
MFCVIKSAVTAAPNLVVVSHPEPASPDTGQLGQGHLVQSGTSSWSRNLERSTTEPGNSHVNSQTLRHWFITYDYCHISIDKV